MDRENEAGESRTSERARRADLEPCCVVLGVMYRQSAIGEVGMQVFTGRVEAGALTMQSSVERAAPHGHPRHDMLSGRRRAIAYDEVR